jgi:tetratricopeptide (TPR) repeat protein
MYHGLGKSIEEADALKSAASALRNAAVVHFQLLRKHADAIDCYTASAALSQRCAKMYHVSGKSREEADALKSAAEALHDAAISHFQLGNYADAIDCNTESAALFQSCAEMYGLLEAPTEKACALKGAASALRNAAVSHSQLGNYEAAAKATRESAELYQSCAKVYHGLGKSREEADALKSAAGALSSLASLHTLADNHAAAAQAYEKRAAYTS